jgi:hypothetical protein
MIEASVKGRNRTESLLPANSIIFFFACQKRNKKRHQQNQLQNFQKNLYNRKK